jgi:hypothetical protein
MFDLVRNERALNGAQSSVDQIQPEACTRKYYTKSVGLIDNHAMSDDSPRRQHPSRTPRANDTANYRLDFHRTPMVKVNEHRRPELARVGVTRPVLRASVVNNGIDGCWGELGR